MKAIAYDQYGDESVLQLRDLPEPKVGPDRVLVNVKAAGVNRVDAAARSGAFDQMMDVVFPVVPGWDVAGVVEAVGYTSTEFAIGDEVLGYAWMDYIHAGSYAERMSAPIRTLVRKPQNVSWETAAGLPLAGLTAFQAVERVGIKAGETVLVHGAAGGVGSIAIQLVRLAGGRPIGTASPANHDHLVSLGAEPVEYGEALASQVRAVASSGIDTVIDCYGHGALEASIPMLAKSSGVRRMVTVADGATAIKLGAYVVGVRPNAAQLADLVGLVSAGSLVVHVAHRFELADAREAQQLSISGHARGKAVLLVT